jgi:hypothetical protein
MKGNSDFGTWIRKGVVLAVVVSSTVRANAAGITWGAATTISSDTDVSTSGALVYAIKAQASIQVVNSTYFGYGNNFGPFVTLTAISGGAGLGTCANPALSPAYQNVVGYAATGAGTNCTFTLNGLTVGHNYQVQVWINDSRSGYGDRKADITSEGGNTVNIDYNNTNGNGGNGQYAIGTFTADATTQTITEYSAALQLNAIQLRDLSATLPIEWSVGTVSGASDVSTNGILLYAYTFGNSNTVNTVPFKKATSTTDFDGSGKITASGWQGIAPTGGGTGGMTVPYSDIIYGFLYRDSTAATVTLNNLTAGKRYQVQIWAQSNQSTRYQWVSGGDGGYAVAFCFDMGASNNGQYAIGTFVASSSSETLRVWGGHPRQDQLRLTQYRCGTCLAHPREL